VYPFLFGMKMKVCAAAEFIIFVEIIIDLGVPI
jgi:hypothetical protein